LAILTLSQLIRPTVLRKLRDITMLDGCPVNANEKAMFADNAGALSLATIMQHGTAGQRLGITGEIVCEIVEISYFKYVYRSLACNGKCAADYLYIKHTCFGHVFVWILSLEYLLFIAAPPRCSRVHDVQHN